MFIAPNGEKFYSKAQYRKQFETFKEVLKEYTDSVELDRKGSHTGSARRKAKCPKCSKVDNLTRDWYGNLLCPSCYRRSL